MTRLRSRLPWLRLRLAPFFAAMFISNVARNSYYAAVAWIALEESGNVSVVAFLLLLNTVAEFLTSGVSGYLADRIDLRRFALSMDIGRSVVALVTGIAMMSGAGTWALAISIAVYSSFDRAYLTSMQTMVPTFSKIEDSVAVNSASYLMMQTGNFIGALGIGWLLHLLPSGWVYITLAGLFFSSSVILTGQSYKPSAGAMSVIHSRSVWREALDLSHIAKHHLVQAVACYSVVLAIGVLVNTLLPGYVLREMNGTSVLFGKFESGWALGAVVVCLMLVFSIGKATLGRGLLNVLSLSGLILLALWCIPHPVVSFVALAALGGLYNAARVAVDVQIQQRVTPGHLGRTKGAVQTVATGYALIIYGLLAVFGESLPASASFGAYGLFALLVAGALLLSGTVTARSHHTVGGRHE